MPEFWCVKTTSDNPIATARCHSVTEQNQILVVFKQNLIYQNEYIAATIDTLVCFKFELQLYTKLPYSLEKLNSSRYYCFYFK